MLLKKTARSVLAMMAILVLLICEGAWAAHALAPYAAASNSEVAAAAGGCHAAHGSDVPESAGRNPCESAQAPVDFYHVPAVALTVVAFAFPLPEQDCGARWFIGTALTPLAGAPLPLHLVHCRLLN